LSRGEIEGRGKRARLTEFGQNAMRLLTFPD